VVTAHLEADFRRPVPVGSELLIRAEVTGVDGRRITVKATGRLDADDGPIAVRCAAVFVEVPLEHFFRFGRREDVEEASARAEVQAYARHFEVNP
jgi:acyl-CoA thioesterase FadM